MKAENINAEGLKAMTAKSYALRRDILDMVYHAGTGHIGGDFSVCDIINVLYSVVMNISPENFKNAGGRDHFILSKGHSVEALYAVLADRGFFPKEELQGYSSFGSKYIGHPTNKVNGIEMNSGSLGHGLSVGVGMALANRDNRVYVVMGDGEQAEGSVWEGAMAAGHYSLSNLCAVVDRNHLQISGTTEAVMTPGALGDRYAAFGWNVISVNGNDTAELIEAFKRAEACREKPTVLIAETIKGYGVSFMENRAEWHHRVPTREEYRLAFEELGAKEAAV